MEHMGRACGGVLGALGAVLPLLLPWRERVVISMCSSPGMCWGIAGVVPWGSSRAGRACLAKWREALTHPWGSQALAKIGMGLRQPL